ncbi:MAG: hypothetical protein M1838_002237 [Thelocarpon superellum]|nr:MAG: hypothetical protein M1838_002237 [Thelocarpon superellum]
MIFAVLNVGTDSVSGLTIELTVPRRASMMNSQYLGYHRVPDRVICSDIPRYECCSIRVAYQEVRVRKADPSDRLATFRNRLERRQFWYPRPPPDETWVWDVGVEGNVHHYVHGCDGRVLHRERVADLGGGEPGSCNITFDEQAQDADLAYPHCVTAGLTGAMWIQCPEFQTPTEAEEKLSADANAHLSKYISTSTANYLIAAFMRQVWFDRQSFPTSWSSMVSNTLMVIGAT